MRRPDGTRWSTPAAVPVTIRVEQVFDGSIQPNYTRTEVKP